MKVFNILLFPFALLLNGITKLRNCLFDKGFISSVHFDVPIIVVGNLNSGGSGKTPMVEYLVKILKFQYHIAIISRGYKRSTKGYRVASEKETATTIGDEPLQFYRKFGDLVKVAVAELRAEAITKILNQYPETNLIILDDAFQHRYVSSSLSILLTSYRKPFFSDYLLPYGRLRESRSGAKRADIVVVTKCETEIETMKQNEICSVIESYSGVKPIFFATNKYLEPVSVRGGDQISKNVILVSGIAEPKYLVEFMKSKYELLFHFKFFDHHKYNITNIANIDSFLKKQKLPCSIITTEKDMVKLIDDKFRMIVKTWSWFYIPYQHEFLGENSKFDELIFNSLPISKT